MTVENELQRGTQRGRVARIEALQAKIRENKKMYLDDVYRYALRNFAVSKRVIDTYIQELILRGHVRREEEPQEGFLAEPKIYLIWAEEE